MKKQYQLIDCIFFLNTFNMSTSLLHWTRVSPRICWHWNSASCNSFFNVISLSSWIQKSYTIVPSSSLADLPLSTSNSKISSCSWSLLFKVPIFSDDSCSDLSWSLINWYPSFKSLFWPDSLFTSVSSDRDCWWIFSWDVCISERLFDVDSLTIIVQEKNKR